MDEGPRDDDFTELLLQRCDELRDRYRSHREEAAARIVDSAKYDRAVFGFLAAGDAALGQAFCDGLFDWQCHAWLAAFHMAFLTLAVDDFGYPDCHFQATAPASAPQGAVISRQEYLHAFALAQDEAAAWRKTIKGTYKAFRKLHAEWPYRLVNAALLSVAAWKGKVAGDISYFLERYFAVFYRFVEVEEFGLLEVAEKLAKALDRDKWN